jgi:hypothetical protein
MSKLQYINIAAYRVTWRLHGNPMEECFRDLMAEYLPCNGCGAPKGYFCFSPSDRDPPETKRLTCKGIIGSQNPRTLLAFAKGAEEILAREAKK